MEKQIGDVENKIPDLSGLVNTMFLMQKLRKFIKKIPDTSGLLVTVVVNSKIGEVENKITDVSGLVK